MPTHVARCVAVRARARRRWLMQSTGASLLREHTVLTCLACVCVCVLRQRVFDERAAWPVRKERALGKLTWRCGRWMAEPRRGVEALVAVGVALHCEVMASVIKTICFGWRTGHRCQNGVLDCHRCEASGEHHTMSCALCCGGGWLGKAVVPAAATPSMQCRRSHFVRPTLSATPRRSLCGAWPMRRLRICVAGAAS